ncbi:MAG: DUF2325 domain-containing protein [Thermaerobacter sp.]|nr:DUF2325 domain-containing protein [Thermaerobacter sp.]
MPSLAKLLAQYLQSRLDRLSPEGLPQVASELEAIAAWIRLTDALPPELRNAVLAAAPDGVTPDADPVPALSSPPARVERDLGQEFHRRLRGGVLWPGHVRVPETVVRELHLATGDRLSHRALPNYSEGPPHYDFTVLTRGSSIEPRERREEQMALVELEGDALVVRRFADGRPWDPPVALRPEDAAALHFHEGSVVDLAYWADDPQTVRVAWVHHLGSAEEEQALATAESAKPKPKAPRVKRERPDPVLDGKRVLVVGNEPRQSQYAKAIELRGGAMEWSSGDDGDDRLAAALRRVDAALILKNHCSHHASESATQLGKQLGIPVRRIGTDGIKSVADWAVTLITTQLEDVDDDAG